VALDDAFFAMLAGAVAMSDLFGGIDQQLARYL
jgi:hypothetical protein